MCPDYYAILGVAPDASPEQVRAAYRLLAKKHHTDAGGDPARFRTLQQAYETLNDPALRRRYDAERESHFHTPSLAEPLIPSKSRQQGYYEPAASSRLHRSDVPETLEDFDRLFQKFDEFFERLEEQLLRPYWGRNE
ncbi:MAG: DnaJ domain-containing protein [Acidobacteria bacterium]|nr:DnaJ domain-containing protein [Acidobacteriota bacterium]